MNLWSSQQSGARRKRAHQFARTLGPALVALAAACSARVSHEPTTIPTDPGVIVDAGRDRVESGSPQNCGSDSGQCTCCEGPGVIYDGARKCRRTDVRVVMVCLPRDNYGDCPLLPDEVACYRRTLDDAGVEVVITPHPYGPIAGYVACDDALKGEVVSSGYCR